MACSGVIAAAGLALTLASAEPVVFATEAPFAPYTTLEASGAIGGFEREIGDEVCARARLVCQWRNVRFDRLVPGVLSGEFDVILGGLAVTPERMALLDFTLSYTDSTGVDKLYGRSGAPGPAQARVAVQSGTIQQSHALAQGWTVTAYGAPTDVVAAVLAGKADLAFGAFDAEVAPHPDLLPLYEEEVPDMGTAMAVCRGNDALLTQLNAALEAMARDGTIDEITARWL